MSHRHLTLDDYVRDTMISYNDIEEV